MGMDVGEQSGSLSSPNIVPLIDILLVLIIIFMVITPLIPKGLDTLVPQPNPNQKQDVELENKTVVVQVSKDGKVKINQDDSNWEQLGPRIEQIFKERAEKIAFTPAYVEIEATYLVPAGSPLKSIADVDKPGVRIAVSARSAYDLWLARNIK